MHDTRSRFEEQCIELPPQSADPARLYLNELAVRADEIDRKPAERHLNTITRPRKHGFDRRVQRTFTQHCDP